MKSGRRQFMGSVLGTAGASLLGPLARGTAKGTITDDEAAGDSLPPPDQSGIEHIVVVTMENRSFDHFLGWLPNADGKQAGLTYVDSKGVSHSTYPLAPDYTGCPHPDPDHSYNGARVEYDKGAMDGFLRAGGNDVFSIGYYVEADRPFYNSLARNYTTLDQYFCSILGPTFPNRFFLHAAQTDRLGDSVLPLAGMTTIWDHLARAGVRHRYYFSNLPFLSLWGLRYIFITFGYSDFLNDAANGTLPAVSFVDPPFTILDDGLGEDDHPHADIRRGDAFLAQTFHAVATGPKWANTVFIVNYDEWGGFFEHVAPPRVIAPNKVDPDLINGKALLGFRVPTVVASPFSLGNPQNPRVNGTLFDHTSVLKLIEWRWNVQPLTKRDASNEIGNLATALDFTNPNPNVPSLPMPTAPPPVPCLAQVEAKAETRSPTRNEWEGLLNSGLLKGWEGKVPIKLDR